VIPASRQLRVALGVNPARPTGSTSTSELRLRPVREPSSFYLFVENPSEPDRDLLVQLLDGEAVVPGCDAAIKVKAHSYEKVIFGAPSAKPEADFVAFRGPLRVRVADASDPEKALIERTIPVVVAPPTDMVRVVDARYEPPGPGNDNKSRLSFRLRAVAPVVGPPCAVELVITPDRVPGLLSPGEGTFRAVLAAEGDEAVLFAEGLRLDERDEEDGHVILNVDGVERALVFRTTFARQGEPTTPRQDDRPAVRLLAPRAAFTGAPFEVAVAADNPPPGGLLELTLGRSAGGVFPDRHEAGDPRRAGFDPHQSARGRRRAPVRGRRP